MADTATVEQVNGTETIQNQERTFTQAELDDIVKARVAKERAKYADFELLQQKAAKFDEYEEANKSELQKATDRAEALQRQLDEMTKANDVRAIREKVSTELGLPANLLTGETEDACKTQAEAILAFANKAPAYPTVRDAGEVQNINTKSAQDQFADWFNASLNN